MQLRRMVIGEAGRFPELAKVLYESGPQRALTALETLFARLTERGLLGVDDPGVAASQFNWLIMAEPVNRAMLRGDPVPGRTGAPCGRGRSRLPCRLRHAVNVPHQAGQEASRHRRPGWVAERWLMPARR
jgi:hypothetical protein